MTKIEKVNEKRIAGASYIIGFYENINLLTHNYAQYLNFLIELENKYKNVDLGKISEQERGVFIQSIQEVRYFAHKCYIMYKTIILPLNIKEDQDINNFYEKIKANYIIDRKDIEMFTVSLNSVLMSNVVQDLIDTSQTLLDSIYSENAAKENQ